MVTIIVTQHPGLSSPGDFFAHIKDKHGYWGCGRTPDEAIGALINACPEQFDITIEVKEASK